jgi:Subtilase family
VPVGLPRRVQAGVAVGSALTFLVMASSPALADHVRSQEWWLRALHVTSAWRTTHGAGVTVALLDTGVDAKQADLTGSVITGPDDTHSGRTPGGALWGIHGTAMASIIAGHGHGPGNADGVIGVAPSAKILSVRVTLESNDPLLNDATIAAGLPNAIARGIRYAVKQHAAVIDLPLDPVTTPKAAGSGGSPAERAAVAYALRRHVVLVAPAGDGGAGSDPVNYPAAYPGVISVGAFNDKFVKAPYSSHRPYVTLTAAGDGVTAANGLKGYTEIHSTSAASAVVAGVVALIKAQFPALTPDQVRRVLTTSTAFQPQGGRSDGSGYGTVDAGAALMAASKLAEAVPAAATGASASPQAPPSAPAVHSTLVRKNLGHSLMTDVAIAVAVFLVLLGSIFGVRTWRRRRARSARLAEVRAATRVPAGKPRKPASGRKPASRKPASKRKPASSGKPGAARAPAPAAAGTVTANGPAAGASWSPAGNSRADGGFGGGGLSGAGLSGAGLSGAGLSGAGLSSAGRSGSWVPGGADGRTAGIPGRAAPQIEPVGFVPAPLGAGSEPGGFTGSGSASPGSGSANSGSAGAPSTGAAPAGGGQAPSGGAAADPAASNPTPVNAPPWAPIPDPTGRLRGAGDAAIPDSAFPDSAFPDSAFPDSAFPGAAGSMAEPPGEPGAAASGGRSGGRRAQGSHRASQARPPTVSGRPPWDPAPEPDSELPWTQAPAPPRDGVGLPQRQPARPEMPTWEAIAEEAWPGGPRSAKPHPSAPSAAAPDSGPARGGVTGPVGSAGAAGSVGAAGPAGAGGSIRAAGSAGPAGAGGLVGADGLISRPATSPDDRRQPQDGRRQDDRRPPDDGWHPDDRWHPDDGWPRDDGPPRDDGRPQESRPIYAWNSDTGATAAPRPAGQPEPRFGFLRGIRSGAAQQPSGGVRDGDGPASSGPLSSGPASAGPVSAGTGPAAPRSAGPRSAGSPTAGPPWESSPAPGAASAGTTSGGRGPADAAPGTAPPRTGSANAGPRGTGSAGARTGGRRAGSAGPRGAADSPSGTGLTGSGPAGAASPDTKPKTGVPPWEITDSFLAIRTDPPGAPRGDGASSRENGPPWEPSEDPQRASGTQGLGSFPATGSFPTAPRGSSPANPRGSFPTTPTGSFPAAPGGSSPANPTGSFPTAPRGSSPANPTGSFPTAPRGSSPANPTGSFPTTPRGSSPSAPTGPAEGSGFPRASASFPGVPAQGRSFPSGSDLFSRSNTDGPAVPRGGGSFPGSPPGTPNVPRSGGSFPATPGGSSGPPGGLTPADGSGDSTESFPSVGSGGAGRLPRRIPLSERTGTFPPAPQRHDDDAFRLFPFGKKADTPPAAPPGDNTED